MRSLIETGITVGAISADLYCVPSHQIGKSLWEDLDERGFDRCGITDGDRLLGYVERAGRESAKDVIRAVQVDQLVAENASLWEVMSRLAGSKWLLVLTSSGVTGIVTVADLAKQPARLLMFGIVSLLEMSMLTLIRLEYPDDGWRDLVSSGRLEKARGLFTQRRAKGQDIDLADCLQWSDKAAICAKTERLRLRWGFSGKGECDRLFARIQDLRDQLAHSQHPAPDGDWGGVAETLGRADKLLSANMELLAAAGPEVTNAR